MTVNLVFVDTRQGVVQARAQYGASNPQVALIALSAEAWEASAALGVDCRPISSVVQVEKRMFVPQREALAAWMDALGDFENRLAGALPGCRFEGPGILMSHIYQLALAVNAVRHRTGLMIAAAATLKPAETTVIESHIDPWFEGAGYDFNPWTLAFRGWLEARDMRANLLRVSATNSQGAPPSPLPFAQSLYLRALGWARKKPVLRRLQRALGELGSSRLSRHRSIEWSDVRILFSDTAGVNWSAVYRRLDDHGARLYLLERDLHDPSPIYREEVSSNREGVIGLPVSEMAFAAGEQAEISSHFDRWAQKTAYRGGLSFAGIDTLLALQPYVRALAVRAPELLRKTDAIIASALDKVMPQAVCFFAIAHPYHMRMAHACAQRGIPVVCYQHGGAYGTHEVPVHDLIENAHADYFMVYGPGILPSQNPLAAAKAVYVPVGSARLDALRNKPVRTFPAVKRAGKLHVVWAGDFSMRNGINAGTEIEDTARYRIETECLALLARNGNLRLTYRPFQGDMAAQGTPAWLRRMKFPNVTINTHSSMIDLLRRADLLVTISTSGTLWNEALAMGLPMVAYSNPAYTQIRQDFIDELSNACILCRDDQALCTAVEQLARDESAFLARFKGKNSASFLREYVLNDGDCVVTASRFLANLCRSSPDDSENTAMTAR